MWLSNSHTLRQNALLGISILLVLGGIFWWNATHPVPHELVYVIPMGTAERIAAGQELTLFPETITLNRADQDTLVIRNEDSQAIQVGPYKIGPGQRFSQRFYNRGTYELLCSVHKSERLRIIVQ